MKLRFWNSFWVLTLAASTLVAGCDYIKAPEPETLPKLAPTPKPGIFDSTLYNTAGVKLNATGDPKLPEYFEVVRIYSGNLFWVRSADIAAAPTPAPPKKGAAAASAPTPTTTPATPKITYGAPEIVRLAGVAVPLPGQPGAGEAVSTLTHWAMNRKLSLEQDPKYPFDFDETDLTAVGAPSARRVQIFFEGGPKDKPISLNLNRLMIRSGYAVVDEHEPTIFDTKGWLNDEQYASLNHLGLWKLGILLNGRQKPPVPAKKGAKPDAKTGAAPAAASPSTAPGAPSPPVANSVTPGAPSTPPMPMGAPAPAPATKAP